MYVLTGATGHIGNTLARLLLDRQEPFKILARQTGPALEGLSADIRLGDIFDPAFLAREVHSGDIFIHLAGLIDLTNKKVEESFRINRDGTKIIADFCLANHVRLIFASSVDAIEKTGKSSLVTEPVAFHPEAFKSVYAASKAAGTAHVLDLMETKGLDAVILYPSAVIGINDFKPSAAGKEIRNCFSKRLFFYIRGGYNFIDVRDCAMAIWQAGVKHAHGSYILSGHPVTIREFFLEIAKTLHRKIYLVRVSVLLARIGAIFMHDISEMMVDALIDNYNYSNERMQRDLLPALTPFSVTVKDTVEWLQKQKTDQK
jgi:dihydroflavonol-4-reductase